jgi:hypothetical protein
MKVLENKEGLKLNGEHKLMIHANNYNLLGEDINIAKENTEGPQALYASKEVCLEVKSMSSCLVTGYREKSLYKGG